MPDFRFVGRYFRKLHAVHQPVHSANADVNAIITLENELYFIGAEALIIIRIDMKDKAFDKLVSRYTRGSLGAEMLVKRASVDIKHAAAGFDFMLETEPAYGV